MSNISLKVVCPVCSKYSKIKIDTTLVSHNERGITAVRISNNIVCEHSFLVYVDKNFDVRDCISFDFTVKLPEIEFTPEPSGELEFDVDIIKINLLPSQIVGVLKGIFHKKKILLLSDEDFLSAHYDKFFAKIVGSFFLIDITFMTLKEYNKDQKFFKHHLVLRRHEVLNDKKKLLNSKNTKIESAIVEEFFNTRDNLSSVIILKNEIHKVHMLAHSTIEFVKQSNTHRLNSIKLLDFLKEKHAVEVNSTYMQFIVDVVNNYFKEEIDKKITIGNSFIDLL